MWICESRARARASSSDSGSPSSVATASSADSSASRHLPSSHDARARRPSASARTERSPLSSASRDHLAQPAQRALVLRRVDVDAGGHEERARPVVVGRRELERTAEEPRRRAVRASPNGRVSGAQQRVERPLAQLVVAIAPVERLLEVERDELRRLGLPIGHRVAEPLGDAPVERAALVRAAASRTPPRASARA